MNVQSTSDLNTPLSYAVRMADSVLARQPRLADKWRYETGVVLKGLELAWRQTGDAHYWQYIQANMDQYVQPDGAILTYHPEDYNLDNINQGKLLLTLYQETGQKRYAAAAHKLREQLKTQPRTSEGGFWHKLIYPHQLWLDGVYMAGPFLAEYALLFNEPAALDEVVQEILLLDQHTRDAHSGLYYHGWDESRQQRWADPHTGCSPHFWGRAIGWYAIALVDVLELLPPAHPGFPQVLEVLQRLLPAILRVQDPVSGAWYQLLDQVSPQGIPRPGNYREASASCMFVYALAKSLRLGYTPAESTDDQRKALHKAYTGILQEFVTVTEQGWIDLHSICSVAGLGAPPGGAHYRDGSYEYYIGEPIVTNDPKGVGAFLLASAEAELVSAAELVAAAEITAAGQPTLDLPLPGSA